MILPLVYLMVFAAAMVLFYALIQTEGQRRFRRLGESLSKEDTAFKTLLKWVGKKVETLRKVSFFKRYVENLKQSLEYAGLSDQYTPENYFALHFLYGVGGFLICFAGMLLIWKTGAKNFTMDKGILLSVLLGLIGFAYPYLKLQGMIGIRRKNILRALPFTLDLITISVEAGLDFSGAIERIVEKSEMNDLNYEFYLYLHETRLGKRKVEALKRMSDRINIPSVAAIVTSLIQAEELGMRLSQILRIQAGSLREKRMQRAEKLALEAPTKMLLPLAGFIFPAVFMVLLGPMLIQYLVK